MRIKGNIRIDTSVIIGIGYGITIHDTHIRDSNGIKITNEMIHAIVIDYAFYQLSRLNNIYSVYALVARRKATRRIMHNADKMHKIIDRDYNCPLLSRGKPYAWNQEVYDFETEKFIEKNLK